MSDEWTTRTVRQLVDDGVIERPLDGNHGEIHPKTSDFVASGIPFIMAADLQSGRVDTTHCSFISAEQAKTLRKGFSKTGDVLLSHKATMGRTAIVGELTTDYIVLTPQVTYYRVRDENRLNNRFLKFYFDSSDFQELLESWANSGSTRAYLGITAQLDLPILLPPVPEQRAIARVLGALDDKIELSRWMNRTLEELAAALFRSWFVDFDPVVAKAAGRQPAHLRPEIAALFPSHWQDSALGPIPYRWRVGKVDELASLTRGGINPGAFPLETFDHYSIPAFDDGRFPRQELGSTIKSNKFPVPQGCVMISKLNPDTPRIWLPDVTGERRAVCSTEFLVSTPRSPATREFLFSLFSSEAFTSSFATLVTGTSNSHQRVKPDNLLATEIVIPDERLISAFTKLAQPWLAQVTHNIRESRTLAALRDTLLPKLLSGELRVKQAELLVEAKA